MTFRMPSAAAVLIALTCLLFGVLAGVAAGEGAPDLPSFEDRELSLPGGAAAGAGVVSEEGIVRYRNVRTNRCLAIQGANNVNGAPAFQYDCLSNARDQTWTYVDYFDGFGRYLNTRFLNLQTGRCLAVQGANNVNGAPVFQYDCIASAADQRWYVTSYHGPAGSYSILRNIHTGRCLAVQGANNVNGAPAFQYDCIATATDQRWWAFT